MIRLPRPARAALLLACALLVVVGCTAEPTPTPTRQAAVATTPASIIIPTNTPRPSATPLPAASNTPIAVVPPTSTVRPTNTARPASATPIPPTNTFPPPPTVLPVTATSAASSTPVPTAFPTLGVLPTLAATPGADGLTRYVLPLGSGGTRGFWDVFFTAPSGSRDARTYVGGIDVPAARAIAATQRTLDIAAFEFNNPLLTSAVLDALRRGVVVRIVADDVHGYDDAESTMRLLESAGARIRRDNRSAFMHNKFMILDSAMVVTGSWNFTINDTYRNNNNALYMRSPQAVAVYQAEFNEMFLLGRFGPSASLPTTDNVFTVDGTQVEIYFSPDDPVLDRIINAIGSARSSIRFMAFSFTEVTIGDALVAKRERAPGVTISGIFERTGSETRFSELTKLFCAGMDVRQDGNPFTLHHKVFIIDSRIVITGSFNFSANATRSNDENLVVIEDPVLARLYVEEFDRRFAEARVPDASRLTCPA
jgi:hypothetical protein